MFQIESAAYVLMTAMFCAMYTFYKNGKTSTWAMFCTISHILKENDKQVELNFT
jgi:hypothetical protein